MDILTGFITNCLVVCATKLQFGFFDWLLGALGGWSGMKVSKKRIKFPEKLRELLKKNNEIAVQIFLSVFFIGYQGWWYGIEGNW